MAALLVLAVAALSHWVDRLPPYNQHLTADVGEFEIAFGLLFLWAARSRHPALLVPVCLAWALSQTAHAIYHATHLDNFSAGDAAGEMLGFVVPVALSLGAILLSRHSGYAPGSRSVSSAE